MGKIQSKQIGLYRKRDGPEGECIVVNAHFNPVAVSEYEESIPVPVKPSSELSFCITGSTKDGMKAGFAEDKYPLKVVLPPEGTEEKISSSEEALKEEVPVQMVEKSGLSLEEFECDVSVKAEAGMEKQEFLFTLYDFDGHGKITKDDIAGLVRSIYDAVGSSIKLPPSGSKTIKVKLTVSPDKKETKECQGKENPKSTPGSSPAADSSKTPLTSPTDACNSPRRSNRRSRPNIINRQNLLDMIHANIEKSHSSFRKHNGECGHACEEGKHRHRYRHGNNRENVLECRDRRNHYLDLAGVENYTSRFNDNCNSSHSPSTTGCPYQLMDGTHVCSKSAKSHLNSHTRKAGHHRSRSHDLTTESLLFRYQLLDKDQAKKLGLPDFIPNEKFEWNHHVRSKSYDAYDSMCSPKLKAHLRKSIANGHSSSPHHHKHRNREREHQRAMQQVANWIEREHLGGDRNSLPESPLVVERHEHHHVHEHIHHHYHHYNDV